MTTGCVCEHTQTQTRSYLFVLMQILFAGQPGVQWMVTGWEYWGRVDGDRMGMLGKGAVLLFRGISMHRSAGEACRDGDASSARLGRPITKFISALSSAQCQLHHMMYFHSHSNPSFFLITF